MTATENQDGTLEKALPAAQVAEVWFLNPGDPQDKMLRSSLLRMLDLVFAGTIETEEKIRRLQQDHGFAMNAEITDNQKEMQNMELAIEARARDEGRREGRMETAVEVTLKTARALNALPASILSLLTANLGGNEQQARQELDAYLRKHPEEETWRQGVAGASRGSLKDVRRRNDKQRTDSSILENAGTEI